MKNSLRIILAVLAGDMLCAGLTVGMFKLLGREWQGEPDTRLMSAMFALLAVFALAGGYLAASIARQMPMFAGFAVGVILSGSVMMSWISVAPAMRWLFLGAAVLMLFGAISGGILRARTHPEAA